jgi:hypothetical protein
MKTVVTALFLLGACSFSASEIGDDDGSGSGSGDPHPDAGNQGGKDTDQDGVADPSDNCPTLANADQRDHDADGRGDVCDVCPHLPDTGGDADGDGVGDACDPRPTRGGDKIALFDGFYTKPSWDAVIGPDSWEVVDGVLHQSHTDTVYQLAAGESLGDVFVDARLKIGTLASTTARKSISVVAGYKSITDFYFCSLAITQTTAEVNAGKVYSETFFNFVRGNFGPVTPDWTTVQMRTSMLAGTGTHVDCLVRRGGINGRAQFDEQNVLPGGDIGFRTNGADTSFDYIFVVSVPAAN